MEEHLITEESKLSQEMSNMHEQLEKNKGVALKASSKEKKSSSSTSKTMVEEDSDEDSDLNMTPELMALFVKKFNKCSRRVASSTRAKTKTRSRQRGLPRGYALGVARRITSLRSVLTSK
jgi:hypothetical protein